MVKSFIAQLLLFFVIPVFGNCQSSSYQILQLDSIFNDWNTNTPGGVACVIYKGATIYKKAFGMADLNKKVRNETNLKFDLASNAKQFTAMCIALLEEQGKLSIEDDLRKYYPDLKIEEEIKIKNLIDHTSGIRDASVLAVLSGKMNLKGEVRKKYRTKEYFLKCLMRETDLSYPVGTEMAYNNFNYVLLGDIVEKVSGKTLSAFADSSIFKPLGMTHTILRDKRNMKISNEAVGYLFNKNKFKIRYPDGGIVGDHNLLSTVDDLTKWQENFFSNRLGKSDQHLIDKICSSSSLNNGSLTRYGYGLWIGDYKGVRKIGHGGDDGRHTSIMMNFPEHGLAVIVLANSSRYNDTERKANKIINVILKASLKEPTHKQKSYNFVNLPENELKSHVGLYTRIDEHGLAQLTKITLVNGSLYISYNYFWQGLRLDPLSPEHFIAKTPEGEIVDESFTSESGRKCIIGIYKDNPPKKYVLKENTPIIYKNYAGSYQNTSTAATIKIKYTKTKLIARKGILRIPLIPFATDQFYAPENHALFIFNRNLNGQITSFKVNAPDFRNFIFEKH